MLASQFGQTRLLRYVTFHEGQHLVEQQLGPVVLVLEFHHVLVIRTGHLQELRLDFDALGKVDSFLLFFALLLLFLFDDGFLLLNSGTSVTLHRSFCFGVEDHFPLVWYQLWIYKSAF